MVISVPFAAADLRNRLRTRWIVGCRVGVDRCGVLLSDEVGSQRRTLIDWVGDACRDFTETAAQPRLLSSMGTK